ncbi:heterokaryon incompatibility protein-domain-containing protein, partial [Xylaria sp. FL1777]
MTVTSQEPLSSVEISIDIDSNSAPCVKWLRLETSPEYDPISPKNVEWIKGVLHELEQENMSLGVRRDGQFLPTRLIDLGVGNLGRHPRLVLATDLQSTKAQLAYAALSYCWGPPIEAAGQFKTTRATLQQRLARIDIGRTTPVIKDAADICKALGIRYLWVDAVCIIQDDNLDWEQEALQMCDVYRNSSLTICTLLSSSCSQGFLEKRSRGIDIPFRSRVSPDIVGHYTLRSSITGFIDLSSRGHPESEDTIEAVWGTRAWTFQELHSSRVLLSFGRRKIHIMSKNGTISEGEMEYTNKGAPTVTVPFLEQRIANDGALERELIYNDWMELTASYSVRRLIYPTDKFPALSGLAAYYKGLLGSDDQYLAGLWEKDLHRQLFWVCHMPQTTGRRTFDKLFGSQRSCRKFIAPSWSWANLGFRFENSYRYFHTNGSYKDYRPEYSSIKPRVDRSGTGVNPYGQIENASLTITSRVRGIPSLPERLYDDAFTCPLWQLKDLQGRYLADCSLDWDVENDDSNPKLELILLGSCIEGITNGPFGRHERYTWGLIIHPASRDEDELSCAGNYYRVGVFYSKPKGQAGLRIFEGCNNQTVCL